MRVRRVLRMEHDLDDALPVPEVDERDAAVVPAAGHPATQDHSGVDMLGVSSPHAWLRIAVR